MYKSIFQRSQKTIDFTNEIIKINELLLLKIPSGYRALGDDILYWDLNEALQKWKYRGTASSLEEFLYNHDLKNIILLLKREKIKIEITQEEFLTYMDILLNLISSYYYNIGSLSNVAQKVVEQIKRCLEYINYEPRSLPDGRVLIIEIGASLPNLSAEEQPNLEENILQYNLKVNKGNIQRKKEIIFTLANEYEQQLKHNLHETLPQFADKLRHAVNKMDIRHNNHTGANRNEYLSTIPNDQYEQLLDDIFKCLLTLHWCADARPAFQRICEALELLEKNK